MALGGGVGDRVRQPPPMLAGLLEDGRRRLFFAPMLSSVSRHRHPSVPPSRSAALARLIGHKNDFGFLSSNAYNNCRNNVANLSVGAEVEEQNAPSKVPEMFPGRQKRR